MNVLDTPQSVDGMKRTLLTDGIRPLPGKKTMLYEVESDVFLAILKLLILIYLLHIFHHFGHTQIERFCPEMAVRCFPSS